MLVSLISLLDCTNDMFPEMRSKIVGGDMDQVQLRCGSFDEPYENAEVWLHK